MDMLSNGQRAAEGDGRHVGFNLQRVTARVIFQNQKSSY